MSAKTQIKSIDKKKNKFYAKRVKTVTDKHGNTWSGQWAVVIEIEDCRVFYYPVLQGQNAAVILAREWNSDFDRAPATTAAKMAHEFKKMEYNNKILRG